MFTRTPDQILISLNDDQYQKLMLVLGAAASIPHMLHLSLAVANEINEGNPRWMPYILTEAESR